MPLRIRFLILGMIRRELLYATGRLDIFYGRADTFTALAITYVGEVVKFIKTTPSCNRRSAVMSTHKIAQIRHTGADNFDYHRG